MTQAKKKKIIIAVAAVVAVCVLAAAVLLIWKGRTPQPSEDIIQTGPEGDLLIETEICDLYFPAKWKDMLQVEVKNKQVTLIADLQQGRYPLFDVSFGQENGFLFGQITAKDGSQVQVYLQAHTIPQDSKLDAETADILYAMQDDLNYLCAKLPVVSQQADPQQPQQTAGMVTFSTTYGILCYPEEMADAIRYEIHEGDVYVVAFYGTVEGLPEQPLYDVCFGEDLKEYAGTVVGPQGELMKVVIEFQPLVPGKDWTDEQRDGLYALQETANQVLDELWILEDNGIIEPPAGYTEGDLLVETPYADLVYPGRWGTDIRVSIHETDPYQVKFYGTSGELGEQLLFTIAFGETEGHEITTLTDPDGREVAAYIIFGELTGPEGKEKDRLYAMQEDAAILVEALGNIG